MWRHLWLALAFLALFLLKASSGNELELCRIMVYSNRQVPYGRTTNVVMTVYDYPSYPIILHLSTEHYVLAYRLIGAGTPEMPPKFRRTHAITRVLKALKVTSDTPVAYETGYYAIVKATFWDFEDSILRLRGIVPSKPLIPDLIIDTKITVVNIPPEECVPILKMMRCSDAQNPQKVVIARSTLLRSYFIMSCGISEVSLTYKFFSLDESKHLTSVPNQERIFVLQKHSLYYPTEFELWRNLYVIRVEGIYQGKVYAARCYVQVVMSNVEAIVTGGSLRYAKISRKLYMDGTLSRDYSKVKNATQFSKYLWSCQSEDDYRNKYCQLNMTTVETFWIPAFAFCLDCQYDFTLSVESDDNPKMKSQMIQMVHIVDDEVLHVAIICIKNCAHSQYNPVNKVQLVAKCMDCGPRPANYAWYVSGQLVLTAKTLTMHVRTHGTIAQIELKVTTTDGTSRGLGLMQLMKRVPPVRGSCTVSPKRGIEAKTKFYVCCKDYQTALKPIEYFYYADRVLLTRCHGCDCEAYLPMNLQSIKVLICDNTLTCSVTYVPVTVVPMVNVSTESPKALWNFLNTGPDNAMDLANRGHLNQFTQIIASLAKRVNDVERCEVLLQAFERVHPKSLEALGKMANLTKTLGVQLNPIDMLEHNLLTNSLTKLNEIFETINENHMGKELVEQPFINITVACVTVYDMMARLNGKMPRPPQNIYDEYRIAVKQKKLNQKLVDKLRENILTFDDQQAKNRSLSWLEAMWQTEILYRLLNMARKHGLQSDPNDIIPEAVALEIQCFNIEPERNYTIESSDGMHIVYFSSDLLQEVKASNTNYICLKVVSIVRELNWWYPEEKQPSSVLLSVRIFVQEDDFTSERKLSHSDISFRTIVGKYKPALGGPNLTNDPDVTQLRIPRSAEQEEEDDLIFNDQVEEVELKDGAGIVEDDEDEHIISHAGRYVNCLESGSLKYMQWVRLYRINMDGHAMTKVRFIESTHELQVLFHIGKTPRSWKDLVNRAKCFVPAKSINKTMLIRNNCRQQRRIYMAIQVNGAANYDQDADTLVPNGPAVYSFVFQERSCDSWTYSLSKDKRHWSHNHCYPVLEYQKKGRLHCTCRVLGTYTSYVYHTPAIVVPLELGHVHLNVVLLVAYCVIFTLLFIWLLVLVIWHNNRPSKTVVCDTSGLEHESSREVHDLLVFLKTGGRINAQTTATVRLIFQTTKRSELQFTVMQDPEKPQLARNSTYVLLVRTRDIRIPTRVAVTHNNAGRYPSWYLRRIELVDVQKQMTQVFIVNRWVRDKFLILSSSMVLKTGDYRIVEKWRERFMTEFERLWINWGLWHPITGKWRESKNNDGLSRAQRCCVFVSKIMVTFCIVACCIGPSTRHSAYEDRKFTLNIKEVVYMFISCAIATNLVHFVFLTFLIHNE